MLRFSIILIIITISLFIVVLGKKNKIIAEGKNQEVKNEDKKNLTNLDKIGIIHLIFLFLFFCVDIIDIIYRDSLFNKNITIFTLVYDLQFISWFILIPVFFLVVLVNLIRSLKKEKNGSVIACISLIISVFTELATLWIYASRF